MKHSWLAYVAVAVMSVMVAVVIAGTPSTLRTDPTISIPESVATTTPSTTSTTIKASVRETTTTSSAPETSTTVLTTTTTLPPVDRAGVAVVAVNGASVSGLASRVRGQLQDLGYERARPADGSAIVDETVVYYFPGYEREAEAVALDLDIDPLRNLPVIDAPGFDDFDDDQVAVYLGRDRR